MKTRGTLYGVGVGPGDPELVSLKAVKVLNSVSVIYAAHSTKNSYSLAKDIVSAHVNKSIPILRLDFPMTRDKEELQRAWQQGAARILGTLNEGQDAAFITLGDPMVYSTFGYVMQTIQKMEPEVDIKVIPGITSYQAAAAASRTILAEAEGSFAVISGAKGAKKMKEIIGQTDSLVMLKVYKHYKEIFDTLEQLDLRHTSVLVSRCGLDGQEIRFPARSPNGGRPPYLSTLIIRKK